MKLKADITEFLGPKTVMAGKDKIMAGKDKIDELVKSAKVQIEGKGLEK